ncbi:MAG: hypothetical protein ACTSRG_07875 [Candidatus Helarchaeota archaeon]
MLTEILFLTTVIMIAVASYCFTKTAIKTRKSLPMICEFMIGFSIISLSTLGYAFAYFFLYLNQVAPAMFVTYRFLFELAIGIVGFYIFFDSRFRNIKYNYIMKFFTILIAVIIGEAYLFYFSQNPMLFNDPDFFRLLFTFYTYQPILFFIIGSQKLFSLIGLMLFFFNACFIVLKNKIYSLKTKIFLLFGNLFFLDIIFTIPIFENIVGEIDLVYAFWSGCFAFIIFARLTKINFEAISGIHEILIIYKGGRLLYATGNEQLDPFLVTGALSAIITFLKETFHSEKKARSIDHEDKKVIFSYGEFIITSVISDEDTHIIYNKAEQLTYEFEKHFYGVLKHWNGELSAFSSGWFIIDKIFPLTNWIHKKSVEEFKSNILNKVEQIKSKNDDKNAK